MKHHLKLNYSGQVTIATKMGNVVLSTDTFHNAGTSLLFKYLGYCLAGNWAVAEKTKPYSIKLFNKNGEVYTSCSSMVSIMSAPLVTGSSTTFHFTIPYTYIRQNFNCIRLYGAGATADSEYMAEVDIGTVSLSNGQNLTYTVDWALSIENK